MKDSKEVLANKVLAKRIKDIFDLHKQEIEVMVLVQTNKEPQIYLPKFDNIIATHSASGGGNLINITREMVDELPIDFVKTENVSETEEFKLPKVVEAANETPTKLEEVLPETVKENIEVTVKTGTKKV